MVLLYQLAHCKPNIDNCWNQWLTIVILGWCFCWSNSIPPRRPAATWIGELWSLTQDHAAPYAYSGLDWGISQPERHFFPLVGASMGRRRQGMEQSRSHCSKLSASVGYGSSLTCAVPRSLTCAGGFVCLLGEAHGWWGYGSFGDFPKRYFRLLNQLFCDFEPLHARDLYICELLFPLLISSLTWLQYIRKLSH